jgi:hypothetical protein
VEPAAEAVDDRAPSAHPPSPARPTALAARPRPARLAIYHQSTSSTAQAPPLSPPLLPCPVPPPAAVTRHCSYSRTLASFPRRAVPVRVQGGEPGARVVGAVGEWIDGCRTEWRAENDGRDGKERDLILPVGIG